MQVEFLGPIFQTQGIFCTLYLSVFILLSHLYTFLTEVNCYLTKL